MVQKTLFQGVSTRSPKTKRKSATHDKNRTVRTSGTRFRAAEFFAGIGLVRLAIEAANFDVVFANDIDPDKLHIYEQNFETDDFSLGDIHALAADDLPDCELFTASFPCNDLSVAGTMGGLNSGQSSAFWGLIRLLKDLGTRRPDVVMLENVPGFLLSRKGEDLRQALQALGDLGYAVDTFMIDAANFVPQSRLRMFVVARRGVAGAPIQSLEPSTIRPKPLVEFMRSHPDLPWNVRELPALPDHAPPLRKIIEDLADDDPAWWNEERTEYFMNQLSERHAAVAKQMIDAPRVSYGTAFRRVRNGRSMAELRTDGVAGCLRTPRGGSGRQILFKAGKGRRQVRLLTARECARLQGVPDGYQIDVPLNKALFGFGDAVCVPVVNWIATNYLAPAIREAKTKR